MQAGEDAGAVTARDALGLALALAAGLAVRAFAWSRTAVLFNDGPIFLAIADAIGRGDWAEVLAHPYHPLYPALVAIVAMLPVTLETAAVAVSIFGGLLSIVAVFLFARNAFGREIAWLAAWVVALHPWAVDFSSDVMSDGLYAGLFMLGFAAMARAVERPTVRAGVLCGAAGSLAYLVRPEGAGLVIVALSLLAARALREPSRRLGGLRAAAGMLVVAGLIMAPLLLAVGLRTGEFVFSQKKSVAELLGTEEEGERPTSPGPRDLRTSLPLPEVAIRVDGPGAHLPARNLEGLLLTWLRVGATSLATLRFELIPFVLLGCLVLRRSYRGSWIAWVIGLPILLHSGVLLLLVWGEGYVSRRHALPVWLPVIAVAALGWRLIFVHIAPERWRSPRAMLLALLVVLCVGWGPRDLRARRVDRAPVREAAEWLALRHPESGPVAAQKLRTAYYADAEYVPLMPGGNGRLARYLRRRGARWVVIDEDKLDDHRGLESGIGDWLEPVHVVSSGGRRVLVLAVVGSESAS